VLGIGSLFIRIVIDECCAFDFASLTTLLPCRVAHGRAAGRALALVSLHPDAAVAELIQTSRAEWVAAGRFAGCRRRTSWALSHVLEPGVCADHRPVLCVDGKVVGSYLLRLLPGRTSGAGRADGQQH